MDKEKQIEEMALTEVDILANDLNQHCADLAENYCGDTTCLTCLAHALTAKGYRKASEVAREIFEEIERTCVDTFGNFYIGATHGAFAELKKKYTESEKDK
jgi:ADP-ribosylglycohydrolase